MTLERLTTLLRAASRLRVENTSGEALVDALADLILREPVDTSLRRVEISTGPPPPPSPSSFEGDRARSVAPATIRPVAPPQPKKTSHRRSSSSKRRPPAGPRSWLLQLAIRADLDVPRAVGVSQAAIAGAALESPAQAPLESLFASGRVRAILRELATRRQRIGEVDIAAAVALMTRGEPIARVPRRLLSSLGHTVQLLFDSGPLMLPFARDKQQLLASATRVIGRDRLRAADFVGTPLDGIRAQRQVRWDAMRWPDRRSAVIVVSDLGCGVEGEAGLRFDAWMRFGHEAAARGLRTFVLIPYPRDRWPDASAAFGTALTWDIATGVQALRRSRRLRRER